MSTGLRMSRPLPPSWRSYSSCILGRPLLRSSVITMLRMGLLGPARPRRFTPLGRHTLASAWAWLASRRRRRSGEVGPRWNARSSLGLPLWTLDRRARHGLPDKPSACYTCLQDEDNVDHILAHCVYAQENWHYCLECYTSLFKGQLGQTLSWSGGSYILSGSRRMRGGALTHS